MSVWHIVGVDPGLVHTGVVRLLIGEGEIIISHTLISGLDAAAAKTWIRDHPNVPNRIYIEKYAPRQHYGSDERMVKGEVAFRLALRNTATTEFIRNYGIKRLVPVKVMDLMGLWNFKTTSHHQDLRSAAHIAVLGMMKDPQLNLVLANMVRDALDNNPWTVTDLGGGLSLASIID